MNILATASKCSKSGSRRVRRTICGLVVGAVILSANNAFALVPFIGWGYTVGYGINKAVIGNPNNDAWIGWWDPPANVIRGRVTFEYDPTLITIRPAQSGFLGNFSDNPANVLPWDPSETYPPWNTDTNPLGGPRPGTTSSLTLVGANRVVLNFDFSANPAPANGSSSENFYGLAFETSQHLAGWTIENTNTGQFHEVGSLLDQSDTFMTCSAGSGEYSCGETNSSTVGFGLTAIPTPEPSSLLLTITAGIVGANGFVRRRRSRTW